MEEVEIRQYRYRIVIFGSYILTALVASLPVNTFASLNSIVEKLFNITIVEISLNTLMFPIAHTIFAFPCNWILNKKGIRISYYIAAIFAITGVWLRTLLAPGQPYICLLGSLLSAIGGIFILNTPSRLAITWFKFETVPFITFTGVLINLVSMALGLTIPGALITPDSSKENISSFLRLEAIIVTVPFIILAILIREKPELPPSKAALVINTVKPGHYIKILKSLFTNLEYIKLSLSMALTFGVCIGFLAVLERVLVGIGYTHASRTISICGTSGIIVGIFANIGYSIYLKKTKHYKRVLMIATTGDFIGLAIWVVGFLNQLDEWWQLILLSSLFCFNHFSLPSIYVLFSTEVAFPIDQSSAAGYMMASSQTVGFLAGLIYASILNDTREMSMVVCFITIGCLLLAIVVSKSIKQDLRRDRYESGNKLEKIDIEAVDGNILLKQ